MKNQKLEIQCPSCKHAFALDEIYTSDIEARFQKDYEAKNKDLDAKQQLIKQKELALEKARTDIDAQVRDKLQAEKIVLAKIERQKAQEEIKLELQDLQSQMADKAKKLDEANKKELELRQKVREVEEKEKNLELEIQRTVEDQTKAKIGSLNAEFETKLKFIQKEKEVENESLKNKVSELTKKLEQGSQQIQGEILELVLEQELKLLFPIDSIQPVPKGTNGSDIIQIINNAHGKACGSIVWEFKNTKNWSDGWIQKLKDDQRYVKADVAVLVTSALPKETKNFALIDGVWVADIQSYGNLCVALRMGLIQLNAAKQANLGKNEKMETLYQYLSGSEFNQRVQSIVEAFSTMKSDLDTEKRAMQKLWAKREKEIERVVSGTLGMYGDLEGIIGNTLPRIEGLELASLPPADVEPTKAS